MAKRQYVQGRDYYLFGAGISSTDTTIKLQSLTIPNSLIRMTMAMFGTDLIGYATLDPEIPTREENISFTGITQNPDGTAELTGVTRGLNLISPYTQDITLRQPHIGGSIMRVTNPVQLYNDLANKHNDETIDGAYTFPGTTGTGRPVLAVDVDATLNTELITHGELQRAVFTSGGHVIEDNGTPLPQEPALNFVNYFTLSDTPGVSTDVDIDVVGLANDTTFISTLTNNATFQTAVNNFITAVGGGYTVDQTPDNGTYGLLSGTVNGINTTFTVSQAAYTSGSLAVFRNGLLLLQGASDDWVETTPASGIFDFNTAPLTGEVITVIYQVSGGSNPQTSLQFDDENGAPLGSAGTVDEVEITSPTGAVTGIRVGNKVTYSISSGSGGSGSGDQLLGVLRFQATTGAKNNPISFVTSPAGTEAFLFVQREPGGGSTSLEIWRWQKDPNTGMFYKTHEVSAGFGGSQQGTANYGLAVIGSFLYATTRTGASGNVITAHRYLAADLTAQTTITGIQNATGSGAGVFSDGTDLYINSGGSIFKQYSISGTVATFVADITGAPVGTLRAFYVSGEIVMIDGSTNVTTCTISGTAFVAGNTANYNAIDQVNNSASSTPNLIVGAGYISPTTLYYLYRWQVTDNAGLSSTIFNNNLLLKAFSKP